MDHITLDVEASGATRNKGHPFDDRNRPIVIGIYDGSTVHTWFINGQRDQLREIERLVQSAETIVGFNVKYDLHWLRHLGIDFSGCRVFDCQLAYFLLTAQQHEFPSLDQVAAHYKLGSKLDTIEAYWNSGIDTDCIPEEELEAYLKQDLLLTDQIYQLQLDELESSGLWRLAQLSFADSLVLQEMEYNGMLYDMKKSEEYARQLDNDLEKIYNNLNSLVNDSEINWNSGDQVSAVLYGGTVKRRRQVPDGVYKTGKRAGQVKLRWQEYTKEFPRLVEPLINSALQKKPGLWSSDEETLKALLARNPDDKAKAIIDGLLQIANLSKLKTTYLEGIPKKAQYYNWSNDIVHPQLNQCVVVTGRLSCSKPNLQNIDPRAKELFVSRYSNAS